MAIALYMVPPALAKDCGEQAKHPVQAAYAQGSALFGDGKYRLAASCLEEAVKRDGQSREAHGLLGECYNALWMPDRALAELQLAMQSSADNADYYYAAASAAGRLHKYSLAYGYYYRYLLLGGQGEKAMIARMALEILEHNYLCHSNGSYLHDINSDCTARWAPGVMPIKVFIDSNCTARGFRPEFVQALKDSFSEWAEASEGKLRFAFTKSRRSASIVCSWTSCAARLGYSGELAITHRVANYRVYPGRLDGTIQSVSIEFYTLVDRALPESQLLRTVKAIDLHEVGHAIGLDHSRECYDTMYPVTVPDGLEYSLTNRDRQTLAELYGAPPIYLSQSVSIAFSACDVLIHSKL